MGIRATIQNKPQITVTAVAVIIVAALVAIYLQLQGGSTGRLPTKAYFSIDDGKTWFTDDVSKIPPFDKDGKPAYRAHVWRYKGKEFVSHLERFTATTRDKVAALQKGGVPGNPMASDAATGGGIEWKAPGTSESAWINSTNPEALKMVPPKMPDGGFPEEITP